MELNNILFKIEYCIPVDLLRSAQDRFKSGQYQTHGLQIHGRWHEQGGRGFALVETDNILSIGKFCNQWDDVCDFNVVPLMTDEEVGEVLLG